MASLPGSDSESRCFGADRSFEKIEITANFCSEGWGTLVLSSNGAYESIVRDRERELQLVLSSREQNKKTKIGGNKTTPYFFFFFGVFLC